MFSGFYLCFQGYDYRKKSGFPFFHSLFSHLLVVSASVAEDVTDEVIPEEVEV